MLQPRSGKFMIQSTFITSQKQVYIMTIKQFFIILYSKHAFLINKIVCYSLGCLEHFIILAK
jgi:hypothetical protein